MKSWFLCVATFVLSACQTDTAPVLPPAKSKLSAPGKLLSLHASTVGAPQIKGMWQYKIKHMAKENSLVREGDTVLTFDSQGQKDKLTNRLSKLKAAKKEAEKQKLDDNARLQALLLQQAEAKMQWEKAKRKANIVDSSRSSIDKQKQQLDLQQQKQAFASVQSQLQLHRKTADINEQVWAARIKDLQNRVDNVQSSIQRLSVKARQSGLVIYESNDQGEKPAIGENVSLGRSVLSISSLKKLAVNVEFDESDSHAVSIGKRVRVTLDTHPDKLFYGRIDSLGQSYFKKSVANPKVIFEARVLLEKLEPDLMRPGMQARVEVL